MSTRHIGKVVAPIALIILTIGLAGCQTITTAHTATPVEQGHVEVSGQVGNQNGQSVEITDGSEEFAYTPLPNVAASGRVGLHKHLGIGGSVGFSGYTLDANIALVNNDVWALAVNPTFGHSKLDYQIVPDKLGGGPRTAKDRAAFANILADVLKTEHMTLTVGAKPGVWWDYPSQGDLTAPTSRSTVMGATAGLKVHKDRWFSVTWADGVGFLDATNPSNRPLLYKMTFGVGYKI